jgi:thiopeptide-type bacteriocin biosynthesis protein
VQLAKKREATTLLELFPAPDELCASGPEGSFVHELIVPFVSAPAAVIDVPSSPSKRLRGTIHTRSLSQACLTRRFTPGSEWLYVKLYTGLATADRVLRDLVTPLVKDVKSKGVAGCWFFIRYSDPDFHLRLRFHGDPGRLRDRLQPLLKDALAPMVADNRIWRVQFDTYEREVERYGGAEGMVLSEQLFKADSEAVLALIEMLEPGDEGADERWRLALYGIDRLLDDFGFDVNKKHLILKPMRDAFAEEFRMDQDLRIQLSDKFRKERKALGGLLDAVPDSDHPLAPGLAALQDRSRILADIVSRLKSIEQQNRLSHSLPSLMPLYIHMHANRLLRSGHRQQELVIYDLLTRLYESQLKSFRPSP